MIFANKTHKSDYPESRTLLFLNNILIIYQGMPNPTLLRKKRKIHCIPFKLWLLRIQFLGHQISLFPIQTKCQKIAKSLIFIWKLFKEMIKVEKR